MMGWASTADPMSNVQLAFSTPEQAIKFCKKRGWKYEVCIYIYSKYVSGLCVACVKCVTCMWCVGGKEKRRVAGFFSVLLLAV